MTYVNVAVAKLFGDDKLFTYTSEDKLPVGSIVQVPFGNKFAWAIVISIVKKPTFKTKPIHQTSNPVSV